MKRRIAETALRTCKATLALVVIWFFFPLGPVSFPGGVVKLWLRQANINSEEVLLSGIVIPWVGGALILIWFVVYLIARIVAQPGQPKIRSRQA